MNYLRRSYAELVTDRSAPPSHQLAVLRSGWPVQAVHGRSILLLDQSWASWTYCSLDRIRERVTWVGVTEVRPVPVNSPWSISYE